jgi:hypothetical protein
MRQQLSHRTKNYTLRSNADWLAISSDNSLIMLSESYVARYHDKQRNRLLRRKPIPNDRVSEDGASFGGPSESASYQKIQRPEGRK